MADTSMQIRRQLSEQIGRVANEFNMSGDMAMQLLDIINDPDIPVERIEMHCDKVVGELVERDTLPWSPTGAPCFIITAQGKRRKL